MQNTQKHIEYLLQYALEKKLIEPSDIMYFRNKLLTLLQLNAPIAKEVKWNKDYTITAILDGIVSQEIMQSLQIATQQEIETLQTEIMDIFAARPSSIIETFQQDYRESSDKALKHFYQYCQDIHYVKDTSKDIKWVYESGYGAIDMTINMSKPEKDPRDIAKLAANSEQTQVVEYPSCPLCIENVGYGGGSRQGPRQTLRTIPIHLMSEQWHLQFSPYSYYQEHAIVLKEAHVPMAVSQATFESLFAFVAQFPSYFIGSNAGLPIVGGSILNHDHFQAGRYEFPIMRAATAWEHQIADTSILCEVLEWPVTTLRFSSKDTQELIQFAGEFYAYWESYEQPALDIVAATGKQRHNAITPILRKVGTVYELYIALRNNRTNVTYPDGIFHVHPEIYHIKKENIGLIEVMGLAILPMRLKIAIEEMQAYCMQRTFQADILAPHMDWLDTIVLPKMVKEQITPATLEQFLLAEIGAVFVKGLAHTGIFKKTSDTIVFIKDFINNRREHTQCEK